jgi:hypothetical protein
LARNRLKILNKYKVAQAWSLVRNKTEKSHASFLYGFSSAARLSKSAHPKRSKPMRAPSEIAHTIYAASKKEALTFQRLGQHYTFKKS